MAGLAQVTQGGAEPDPVVVVGHARADSVGVGMVMVVSFRETLGAAGVEEGALGGVPGGRVGMMHEDGAFGAVIVAITVNVRFQLAEKGEGLFVTPLVVAPGCPGVEILGDAAIKGRGIYGAGAAGDPASRHQHGRGQVGCSRRELPVMGAGSQRNGVAAGRASRGRRRRGSEPVLQFVGQSVKVRVIRPGFQQQHRAAWILRQPSRQH